MTISLQDFATGDTNYVAKFNSNNSTLEAAINALQALTGGAAYSALGITSAYQALFGTTVALVGDGSYLCAGSGGSPSSDLLVAAGYCYKPSINTIVSKSSSTTLSFSGQSAATYYVVIDSTGEPTRGTDSSEAVYSVVWTGTAFGTITRVATVVWGAADWIESNTSSALGATYTALDDRLEAGETAAVAGQLARTWQTGRVSINIATGSPSIVTLTAIQANNTLIDFTGALTENATVVVPLGTNPRLWVVTNNTSGAYTLTIKGSSGTGATVTQGGAALLYQDSTNVTNLIAAAGAGTVTSVAMTVPAEFSIAGSPITTSGTLAVSKVAQSPNTVFAGPSGGSPTNDLPAFRALVAADLPSQPYDVGGGVAGVPAASTVIIRYPFPRTVAFPSSLTNSRGVAAVAATAQTDFDILKNGSSFGTMRFAAAGTTASFISASGSTFAAGDILTVVAPASPDATLADVGFSLAGTR